MRTVRITMSAAVLLLLACSESGGPLSTESAVVATNGRAPAAAMTTGSGVFSWEGVNIRYECLDEPTYSVINAPYTYHLVVNLNGDEVYVEKWDKKAITGTLTGLVTGRVWTRVDNVSPMVIRTAGGGMTHYTFRGTMVREGGPTLEFRELYHVSRDANGELRVENWKYNCWLK